MLWPQCTTHALLHALLHNYKVIKPEVKRVALELGSYLLTDPTVQSAGPAYINQFKILVCSEFDSDTNRAHLYTKGMMLAEFGVRIHFDDKHVTCDEVSLQGIVVYHVKSGKAREDRREWHAPWNLPSHQFSRGTPGTHGEDIWTVSRPHSHMLSCGIGGAYLQFMTDLKTGKYWEKSDLARSHSV